jgi:hypothetical protein
MQRRGIIALALVAGGCTTAPAVNSLPDSGLAPDEIPLVVSQICPGDPACPEGGDDQLLVAASKREITPVVEPWVDLNGNRVHDADEPFTDLDGDGKFDPVWIAGHDSGHQAVSVHDPTWVRCYVLRQNQTTLAHCAVDCIGYFESDAEQIRADLDPSLGIDLLMMSATHSHQTQDTLGIWGPDDNTTGYNPEYMQRIRGATVDALNEAVKNLKPAKMSIGSIATEDAQHSMQHYVSDTRDPVVIDDLLHLMQFDGLDGKPIVTVVNWAGHPDSLGSGNRYVSSDWVHYFRESLEAGTGSEVVYINGAEGGQIGPGRVTPLLADGSPLANEQTFRFIDTWGQEIAREALMAFDKRVDVPSPKLSFRRTVFNVHIENVGFQTAFILGLLPKPVFGFDKSKPLIRDENGDNTPQSRTEVAYITLGPAAIITCPGELVPELWLGGYDGSHAGGWPANNPDTVAPPDLTLAPKPPYLFDFMGGSPEHRMVFGLTLDMLGYILAHFNFYLDPNLPYLVEPPGDQHYEETRSISPRADAEIVGTMRQLVQSAAH